jgi:hypothetical protein
LLPAGARGAHPGKESIAYDIGGAREGVASGVLGLCFAADFQS